MLCTTAINTSKTIITQTGAGRTLIQRCVDTHSCCYVITNYSHPQLVTCRPACLPLATQLQKSASITFCEMLPADGRKWEKEPRRWRDRMKIAARDIWTAATPPCSRRSSRRSACNNYRRAFCWRVAGAIMADSTNAAYSLGLQVRDVGAIVSRRAARRFYSRLTRFV